MPQVGVLLIVKHLTEKNPWIPFPSVPFYSSLLYSTRTLHSYHTHCTVQQSNTLRLIDSFSLFALNATTHSPLLALTPFTSMQSNPLQSIQFHSNSLLHLNLLFLLYPSMPYSSSVLIYAHVTLLTVKSTPFRNYTQSALWRMNGLICTGPQSPFQYIPIRHSTPLTILHQSALSQLH